MKIKGKHFRLRGALSVLLALLMLLSCAPLGVFASAAETEYKTGDIIEFGSYPQSEVTDSALKSALTSRAGSTSGWTSYNYYISGEQSDYMKYTDVEYGGAKYRGVYFTQYRTSTTVSVPIKNSYQDDNGYNTSTVYWFKYEPMKWQVLSFDKTTGNAVVLSKDIIDSQQYYYTDWGTRTIDGKTVYPNNYEHSDIRTWLNGTFYDGAFTASEKNAIIPTTLDNSAYDEEYSQYDSNSTTDKVWLLSYSEAQNTAYGFTSNTSSTESRQAKGSAYALCQGLWKSSSNGCSSWRLRSAGSYSDYACYVGYDGDVSISSVDRTFGGVRPALNIHLTSEISPAEKYNVGDTVTLGSYPQSEVTDSALKSALTSRAGSTSGWTSYNYYISGEQSDYMKYTDVEYGGAKYRGVYFTQYRTSTTVSVPIKNSYQDDNGYNTSTVYWFKYEPMKWQVLSFDKTTGNAVVLSKDIIDSQQYYYTDWGTRTIDGKTVYPNNYEHSDIRTWLNGTFYDGAFTASEKNAIIPTTLDNSAYDEEYSQYDSNSTTDKVWLLSYSEAQNTAYGFTSDKTRRAKGSAYALCQGLYKSSSNGRSYWRLRSAGLNGYACYVYSDGYVYSKGGVLDTDLGVRPALNIHLTSEISPAEKYNVGDTVTLGSYPQSEVTDSVLKSALTSRAGSTSGWTSYNYYISGEQSDYMKYTDVEYGGAKYRGVYFTQYRTSTTVSVPIKNSYQDDNGYNTSTVYWFKYEPMKWQVLSFDKTTGNAVVLSKDIIDSQQYYYTDWGTRTIDGKTVYPNNYEHSDIRTWLNGTFYDGAFTASEKNAIIPTTLDNSAYDEEYSQYDSNSTTDKVWLLSYSEAQNTAYGFSSDETRQAKGSAYALCQGLWKYGSKGCSIWRLRSAGGSSNGACSVGDDGCVESYYYSFVNYPGYGVRPALKIHLTSEISPAEKYNVGDTVTLGSYPQSEVTDSSLKNALSNKAGTAASWESYNFYEGGAKSDFMKYVDVDYNGAKYRGVRFTKYRPALTYSAEAPEEPEQQANGYSVNTTYWFKYEPLEWTVTAYNASTGAVSVRSKRVIDSREFYAGSEDTRTIDGSAVYRNNYKHSDIRAWLNGDFVSGAFTSAERCSIIPVTLDNSAFDSAYSQFDSVSTADKVYLLSYNEVQNTAYGFAGSVDDSPTRETTGTDYAKALGVYADETTGAADWWLRTAGDSQGDACYIDSAGYVNEYNDVRYTKTGVVPALTFNPDNPGHTPAAAVEENRVEATCTENGGYDSVVYCANCGEELSREAKTINPTGHTPAAAVEENRKEPNCFEKGSYDSVVYCSVCATELSRTSKTLSAGHDFTEKIIDEAHLAAAATKTSPALYYYDCSRCETIGTETFAYGEPLTDPEEPDDPQKDYKVGDEFTFGSYPQSEVTASSVKTQLDSLAGDVSGWTSYGYYADGKQGDYMKYKDVTLDGEKYRGVYFTGYRPYYNLSASSEANSYQDNNGYVVNTAYWFKFEPVTWRVLAVNGSNKTVTVMAKYLLDSQDFYNTHTERTVDGKTVYANNYEHSDIRAWLNGEFFGTAFTAAQQGDIIAAEIENKAFSTTYSQFDSASTVDKLWILSYSDTKNADYGFATTADAAALGTDYAKAQGIYVSAADGNSIWRLRTAGSSANYNCCIGATGSVSNRYAAYSYGGIRPAMILSTASSTLPPACRHEFADTVVNPTCTEKGYTVHTCKKCDYSVTDTFVNPSGHFFTAVKISAEYICSAATCTVPAVYFHACSVCGKAGGDTFKYGLPLGHNASDWIIDREATFTEEGERHKECTLCKIELERETIPKRDPSECEHEFGPVTIIKDGEVVVRSSIDIAFVVDTTGSMGDDIDRVKKDINTYLNTLQANGIDYRVALVDYRDFASRTGSQYDYAYNVCLDFTNDTARIRSAVSALSLGYGGDAPETVYSALVDGLKALSWREDAGKAAIVMGDAGALDPEPYTGYTAASTAEFLKTHFSSPVAVFGIATGSSALSCFKKIAEATGGKAYSAASSLDITTLVKSIIKVLPVVVVIPGAEWQVRTPATCTTAGVEFRVCVKCKVYEETRAIKPLGHNYTVAGDEATCTEDGHLIYTCTRCGDSYEEFPKALGHLFDAEGAKYHEASCTQDAYSESTCARCGLMSRVDYSGTALGHDMDGGIVVGSGECTYKKVRYSCMRDGCEYYYDEEDGYRKHNELTLMSFTDATCTERGVYEWYCTECGKTTYEYVDALGHDFIYTDNGDEKTHTVTCSRCDYSCVENHTGRKCICGYVCSGDFGVLLVEDTLPWSTSTNEKVLNSLIEDGAITFYDKSSTNSLSKTDFSGYSAILIANDQSSASYRRLETVKSALDSYVYGGGVVIFGACDNGWKGGNISFKLPGGVSKLFKLDYYNKIADAKHPVVTAELSNGIPLTDSDLHSTYCSHTYFDPASFVDGTNVIFTDSEGNATLIEYAYGSGTVLASGLTWEYSAVYRDYAQFSPKGYDDLILYALGNSVELSNKILVRFFGFNNELLSAQYIDKGTDAAAPGAPDVVGHDFAGWLGDYKNVSVSTDVYAQYTPRTYTVTLESTEDGASLKGAGEYAYGSFAVIEAEMIAGKAFTGWFEGAKKVSDNISFGYKVTGNAVLTARYESIASHSHNYTLTYTRAATCFSKGLKVYSCVCGDGYSEYTDKLEHVKAEKTTSANCVDAEMAIEYCTVCNTVLNQTETAPALGHDLKYVSTTLSTCIEYGFERYRCTRCGVFVNKYLSELASHTAGEAVTVAATCVTSGCITVGCTVCRKRLSYTEIPCTGKHTFGEWTVTKEATCAADGVSRRTCSVCDYTESKAIEKNDKHTGRTYMAVIKQATCLEKGTLGTYCLDCHALLSQKDIPAGEHIPGDWVTVKAATCTEAGRAERRCTTCGTSVSTKVIPLLPHTPGEKVTVVEATCTESGLAEIRCANCGTVLESITIPARGHLPGEWITVKAATCKEKGVEQRLCKHCSTVLDTRDIPLSDHSRGEWMTVKEPTCTEKGLKTVRCTVCEKILDSAPIPAKDHTPGEWITVKAPTCSEQGSAEQRCVNCGTLLGTDVLATVDHRDTDNDGFCDWCGKELESHKCNCLCHKSSAISKFFWKILRFFYKIFRVNKVCTCGDAHW